MPPARAKRRHKPRSTAGLLKGLSDRFQVRLYKFGKEPERIQKPDQLTAAAPASRIGDTLERVLAESSSLPLGAIVLLSDGADNAGGIDLATIAAIRRQRIPIHTIGFGKEHPDKDIEITDAVVPARALPDSKLTATVTLQSWGLSGSKSKLTVKESGKVLVSQDIVFKENGQLQSETLVFNGGAAGPKTFEISVDPVGGEENQLNNKVTRVVNVEARKPRILYIQGEPRLGVQVHPPRHRRLPRYRHRSAHHAAHHAEQDLPPGQQGPQGTGGRLPHQARRTVRLSGPHHRRRGSQLLHRAAAAGD